MVDFFVQLIPTKVLPSIFNGCNGYYNTNWDHRNFWLESIHHWHKIQQCNNHKINIGKAVKLLIDIFREESQDGIFCGLNFIGVIVSVWIFLPLLASKGQIGDDHSFSFIFLLSFLYFSSLLQLFILDFSLRSPTPAAGFLEKVFFPYHSREAAWTTFAWHLAFLSRGSLEPSIDKASRARQSGWTPRWRRAESRRPQPLAALQPPPA